MLFSQNQHKTSQSDFFKGLAIKENVDMMLTYCLEDEVTVANDDLLSPFMFHEFLFILSEKDENTSYRISKTNIERLFNVLNLDVAKYRHYFQKGKYQELKHQLYKLIENTLSNSFQRMNREWMRLCYLLFMFYEYNATDFSGEVIDSILSLNLLEFVFGMELERKLVELKRDENHTYDIETELMYPSWQNERQGYKLYPQSLTSPIWNEETKKEFAELYTNFVSKFISKDVEVFKNRGTIDSVIENSSKEMKDKWCNFLIYCIKNNMVEGDISEDFAIFSKNIFAKFGVNAYVLFAKICEKSNSYFSRSYEVVADEFFVRLNDLYIKELCEEKRELNRVSQEEIKSLKSSNRAFIKDIKSYEKDTDELRKINSELKTEIEKLQKSVCNNDEFLRLQQEVGELKGKLQEIQDSESKLRQSSDWKDKRIKELTNELEQYSEIESDLITLQNENNAILSEIERIESFEEESDEMSIDEKFEHIKNENILFVGGTGGMLLKLSNMFPNSDCIDISDMGSNFTVPQRFDYIVIYTKVVTHSHCNRIESQVDKNKIIPINICNRNLVIDELFKHINGHKN